MKTRFALPMLVFSAFVMIVGLGLAHAQPPSESPVVRARALAAAAKARGKRPSSRSARSARSARSRANGGSGAAGTTIGSNAVALESGVAFERVSPRARVTFNLEETELLDLVRLISNMTGRRFILPSKVRSIKATVYAPTKVSVAEAYRAFLSILEVNGLTVVSAGRYYEIIETSGAETHALPIYDGSSPVPASDRYVTRIHWVENVAADDVAQLLTRFKSSDGNITTYAPTNMLIITDTGRQIRRMLRLIERVDIPRGGEQIWLQPIHHANAADIVSTLQSVFPTDDLGNGASPSASRPAQRRASKASSNNKAAGGSPALIGQAGQAGGSSSVKALIADERTNSVIIIASERSYLRILEMIRRIDVPMEGGGRIHVHSLQHGDSEEIASALSNLIGGAGGSSGGGGGRANRGAQAGAASATPDLFEGAIRVTPFPGKNALMITSSLHDYAALRTVIHELDAPRRQVFIEAVIMELSVSRSSSVGLSFHSAVGNFPTTDALSVFGFNAAGSLSPINQDSLTGVALGVQGPTVPNSQQLVGLSIPAFGVVLNALASSGDANVLSTPHIIATDNVEAEISVGQNIPLQTSGIPAGALSGLTGAGGGANGLAGLAAAANSNTSVPRQDVGTTIRFTPHVNDSDQIRLEIQEEISERGATEGDLGVVSINRRSAKTEVTVGDQQTIVIGGLMRESMTTSQTKVPVLGDIPLLGALFRRTSKQKQKTNLILFLTPYIIRDPGDLRAIYERKMRERQEFLDRYFVFGDHDYEPPIDYSRTRGLVVEIMNEVDRLDEEQRMRSVLEAAPPREHVPQEPVGTYQFPDSPNSPDANDSAGGSENSNGEVLIEPDAMPDAALPTELMPTELMPTEPALSEGG